MSEDKGEEQFLDDSDLQKLPINVESPILVARDAGHYYFGLRTNRPYSLGSGMATISGVPTIIAMNEIMLPSAKEEPHKMIVGVVFGNIPCSSW